MSIGSGIDDIIKVAKDAATNKLESNKAINPIKNFTGMLEYGGKVLGGNEGFGEALKSTFANVNKEGKVESWKHGKIAGSYLGAAAAGRVLTGGGVYKDGNGNTNLVGIPFV